MQKLKKFLKNLMMKFENLFKENLIQKASAKVQMVMLLFTFDLPGWSQQELRNDRLCLEKEILLQ